MRSRLYFSMLLVAFLTIVTFPTAYAFKAAEEKDHHLEVFNKALVPSGFSHSSVSGLNAGSRSSEDTTKPEFKESRRHFDDCNFHESLQFVKDKIATGRQKARTSFQHEPTKAECLFALGEALHSLQDFVAHSNFIEWHLNKQQKVPNLSLQEIEKLVRSQQLKSGYFTEVEFAVAAQEAMQKVERKSMEFSNWFDKNKLRNGATIDNSKFHSQPQFEQRFPSDGKTCCFDTAVKYVLDGKDLLRCEINKDSANEHQGRVVVQSKNPKYNGKTLHQLAIESATQLTSDWWQSFERDIWKEEQTACLQIAALKGQPLPELSVQLNAPSSVTSSSGLYGTCDVRIENFPKSCPAPIKVNVKFTLSPADTIVQRTLQFQKKNVESIPLESLKIPKSALRNKNELTAQASWVSAESFNPSLETQTIELITTK